MLPSALEASSSFSLPSSSFPLPSGQPNVKLSLHVQTTETKFCCHQRKCRHSAGCQWAQPKNPTHQKVHCVEAQGDENARCLQSSGSASVLQCPRTARNHVISFELPHAEMLARHIHSVGLMIRIRRWGAFLLTGTAPPSRHLHFHLNSCKDSKINFAVYIYMKINFEHMNI